MSLPQPMTVLMSFAAMRPLVTSMAVSIIESTNPFTPYPKCSRLRISAASSRADERLAQIQFLLERKEAALAQARRHIAMKEQLELWLYVHVPVTVALLAALTAHILSVFLYW